MQQVAAGDRRRAAAARPPTGTRQRFPPSRRPGRASKRRAPVAPESWVRSSLGPRVPSPAGPATPGAGRLHDRGRAGVLPRRLRLPHRSATATTATRFVSRSRRQGRRLRRRAARRPTSPPRAQPVAQAADAAAAAATSRPRPCATLTLEDAGFAAQPPNRTYAVTLPRHAAVRRRPDARLSVARHRRELALRRRSPASATATACGRRTAARSCRSTPATSATSPSGRSAARAAAADADAARAAAATASRCRRPATAPRGAWSSTADRVQSHGLDIAGALDAGGTGLVWTAVRDGDMLPRDAPRRPASDAPTRASIVQVTNLGITVKDSPQNTLVFVTRLDTGAPVPGARRVDRPARQHDVLARHHRRRRRRHGAADAAARSRQLARVRVHRHRREGRRRRLRRQRLERRHPALGLRHRRQPERSASRCCAAPCSPIAASTGSARRCTSRRSCGTTRPTASGCCPRARRCSSRVRDSQNQLVDERTVTLNAWSSAEWTLTAARRGRARQLLGARDSREPTGRSRARRSSASPASSPSPDDDAYVRYEKTVHGSFLVAAYRRPDFRVDVTLTGAGPMAGDALNGVVTARYLFGAPMGGRPVTLALRASRRATARRRRSPSSFGDDRWAVRRLRRTRRRPPRTQPSCAATRRR